MIRFLYTILLSLIAPIYLFLLLKSKKGKPKIGHRWKEYFGVTPDITNGEKPIWIHAVSVGEVLASLPLIEEIKKRHPKQRILVTTTTTTGAQQVLKLGSKVEHRYMPLDFKFAVSRFLKTIKPKELLIIETELWPNTLSVTHNQGVPITIINARLSEKSCQNYARVQKIFNLIHPCLTQVLCQSESDAARFERLGVDKQKIKVTGSIKFDLSVSDEIRQDGRRLRSALGENRPVWIAASTHNGEEKKILRVHKDILRKEPNALLILVPRHPERFNDVFNLCTQTGLKTERRSFHTQSEKFDAPSTQVYLGDTMGEMLVLMGASDVCFMAGSLIGDKVGGHNILEPISLDIPTITGPSYFNFKDIVDSLIEIDGIKISDQEDLGSVVYSLMMNENKKESIVTSSKLFMSNNIGALSRTISLIGK
nr:lipid IV(A) 3-deoxy-D-manno-octulosonic acid transferase [Vibrio splendidus]